MICVKLVLLVGVGNKNGTNSYNEKGKNVRVRIILKATSIFCYSAGLAQVRGDPHFTTFDGYDYTYNGDGEFNFVIITDDGNGDAVVLTVNVSTSTSLLETYRLLSSFGRKIREYIVKIFVVYFAPNIANSKK